jgi:bifunctional UDP-N-acetylglucosamine pyrophosphorylase/glucosamine-1-phosphate N-acetyltransferase
VVVLSADVPLVRADTLRRLLATHLQADRAGTVLAVVPADPSGLGRVVRDDAGRVVRIVEEADIPPGMLVPLECNAGVYVFDGSKLWAALDRLSADNAQGEFYLTDVVSAIDGAVGAALAPDPTEAIGVNGRQLAAAEAVLRQRTLDALMISGVTVEDPATTYVDAGVTVGPDSVIRPMTSIRGASRLGAGSTIGPMAQLDAVRAGDRVAIGASQLDDCVLGDDVRIGAYCRIRPNTVLGSRVELGTHAEVKNSTVGAGTRISHFSCILDSDVGTDVNIGAGTVTCNFDGEAKHRTTIGDGVFVGTNSTLVAPVHLGDASYIGAGSFIDSDVPPGALAVGRARQRNVEGWAARRPRARP